MQENLHALAATACGILIAPADRPDLIEYDPAEIARFKAMVVPHGGDSGQSLIPATADAVCTFTDPEGIEWEVIGPAEPETPLAFMPTATWTRLGGFRRQFLNSPVLSVSDSSRLPYPDSLNTRMMENANV